MFDQTHHPTGYPRTWVSHLIVRWALKNWKLLKRVSNQNTIICPLYAVISALVLPQCSTMLRMRLLNITQAFLTLIVYNLELPRSYCGSWWVTSVSVAKRLFPLFPHAGGPQKITRICASLGSRMKFKTLCYPVFGRHKNTALPSFWFILIAFNASIVYMSS